MQVVHAGGTGNNLCNASAQKGQYGDRQNKVTDDFAPCEVSKHLKVLGGTLVMPACPCSSFDLRRWCVFLSHGPWLYLRLGGSSCCAKVTEFGDTSTFLYMDLVECNDMRPRTMRHAELPCISYDLQTTTTFTLRLLLSTNNVVNKWIVNMLQAV